MAIPSSVSVIRTDLAYYGVVTQIVSATSFIAAGLAGLGDGAFQSYNIYVLKKANGTVTPPHREQVACTAYTSATGLFTHAAFTASLAVGDEVLLLHPNLATAVAILAGIGVPAIDSVVNLLERDVIGNKADTANAVADNTSSLMRYTKAILAAAANLAGQAPVVGNTVANWNAAEADIVSIGADNVRNKLHSLVVNISALVGTVTIRLYQQVNGVERRVYSQSFTVAADGPGLWIVNGTVGIHEVLRATAQSDNAADNGASIDYDYMLEAM